MTSAPISIPVSAPDPAGDALAAALPMIRQSQRMAWVWIAVIIAVVLAIAIGLFSLGGDAIGYAFGVLVVGCFFPFMVAESTRKKHEREVLPTICNAFGLEYQKSPKGYFDTIPKGFIPLGGRRSCDDIMVGKVAGQSFRLAEVKTETGGKNSVVLFKGLVIGLESRGAPPQFLLASLKETKGFLFFKGNVPVQGMESLDTFSGPDGTQYGIWAAPGSGGDAARILPFARRIAEVGPQILGKSTLYSVQSNGSQWHMALRHDADLFRIGGLRADEAKIMADIRTASAEFAQMFRLIEAILKAEEGLI